MKNVIAKSLLAVGLMDLTVVFWSIMQIAAGREVQHIPFWDAQIKFVVNLLTW